MAQQVVKLKTILSTKSPLDDNPTFSTYWERETGGPSSGTELAGLASAYAATMTGVLTTHSLSAYFGQSIDRSAGSAQVVVYDVTAHLNGTPAGAPVASVSWTPTAGIAANPVPDGVAACLSVRADYGTDVEFGAGTRPRARDRNRIYIGPLDYTAIGADSNGRTILSTTFMTDAGHWMSNIGSTLPDSDLNSFKWVVWSRKNAGVKDTLYGWLDDRPDYQRRRSDPGANKHQVGPFTH